MGTIYIVGAILFGTLGVLSVVTSSDSHKYANWLSWVSWALFIPAFYLLAYAFYDFGVAGAYALWTAGVSLACTLQGRRWGEKLSKSQTRFTILILSGLVLFSLSGG